MKLYNWLIKIILILFYFIIIRKSIPNWMPRLFFYCFKFTQKNCLTRSIFQAPNCAPKARSCYCMYVVYAFFYSSFVNVCVFVRPFQKLCSKGYCPLWTVSQDFVQKIRSAGSLIWEPPCMRIILFLVFQSFIIGSTKEHTKAW